MASRPRRTIELDSEEKSAKPKSQQRQSRLVQPKKLSFHGNRQSKSEDRSNFDNANPYLRPSSSAAAAAPGAGATTSVSSASKKRSRSTCYTPLRTPNHGGGGGGGGGGGFGGGSTIRGGSKLFNMNAQCGGTIDRGADRKFLNDKASQIVMKLRGKSCFNNGDFLSGGLKSLTSKQFTQTILIFYKNLIGNARGSRITEHTLTADEIVKWLAEIGYTNLQSKSWMKTPNAPHAYPHLIDLFDFLCIWIDEDQEYDIDGDGDGGIVGDDDDDRENQNNCYKFEFDNVNNALDDEQLFPNKEYIKLFHQTIKNGFQLWNNQQNDEFEQMEAQLTDQYIFSMTGIPTKRQLQLNVKKLTKEYEFDLKNRFIVHNQELSNLKIEKCAQLKQDCDRLDAVWLEKQQIFNDQMVEINQRQMEIIEMEKSKNELIEHIATQALTVEKRNEIIIELNNDKKLIDSKLATVNYLKDIGLNNQMSLTHKQNQFKKLATKFNYLILEIFQKLQGKTEWFGVTIGDLNVDQSMLNNNLTKQLQTIEQHLQNIQSANKMAKKQLELMLLKLQTKQKNMMVKFEMIKHKYEILITEIANNQARLLKAEEMNLEREKQYMLKKKQLDDGISCVKIEIKKSKKHLNGIRKEIEKLEMENNKLVENVENVTQETLTTKNQYNNAISELCEEYEAAIQEMTQLFEDVE